MKTRVSTKGNRTVYVEHGVWFDTGTRTTGN